MREKCPLSEPASVLGPCFGGYKGEQRGEGAIRFTSNDQLFFWRCRIVGFSGEIVFDTSKPDGTPRKLMNSEYFHAMGWAPKIGLEEGISATYRWFIT